MANLLVRYREFIGFVIAGGLATLVNYGLFLLMLAGGSNYLLAGGLGYVSGILVSYAINFFLVFKSKGSFGAKALRYLIAYLIAMAGQVSLLWLLVQIGLTPQIGNAIAIIVVVVLNYFVIRSFVFNRGQ